MCGGNRGRRMGDCGKNTMGEEQIAAESEEWSGEQSAENEVSVHKRRKSQWRPVARQVRSFLDKETHRCAICKSPSAKNYTLFGTASRLCRALLSKPLVTRTRAECFHATKPHSFLDLHPTRSMYARRPLSYRTGDIWMQKPSRATVSSMTRSLRGQVLINFQPPTNANEKWSKKERSANSEKSRNKG